MPIRVQCQRPSCRHVLTVRDDMGGKRGLCPKCHGVIAVPGAAPAPPSSPAPPVSAPKPRPTASMQAAPPPPRKEPDYEVVESDPPEEERLDDLEVVEREEEALDDLEVVEPESRRLPRRRKKARGGRGDWDKVHTGLNMVLLHLKLLIGICVAFIGLCCIGLVLSLFVSAASAAAGSSPGAGGGGAVVPMLLGIIVDLALLASAVLWVLGLIFCCFAPTQRGCRALALTALGCALGPVLFIPLGIVLSLFPPIAMVGAIVTLGGMSLPPLSVILFLLFLRSVAAELRAPDQARTVLILLFVLGGTFVGEFLVIILASFLLNGMEALSQITHTSIGGPPSMAGTGLFVVFALVALTVGIAEFIWYVRVVSQMRELVGDRLRGN